MVDSSLVIAAHDTATMITKPETDIFADDDSQKDSNASISSNQRCHLLELPGELLMEIYLHALEYEGTITLGTQYHPTSDSHTRIRPCLVNDEYFNLGLGTNILATCKQIHHEATYILYANNSFAFNEYSDYKPYSFRHNTAVKFVNDIGTSARFLKDIKLIDAKSKKNVIACFKAFETSGAHLTKLSLCYMYRRKFDSETMALKMLDLVIILDKQHKKDPTEKKTSDVLDIIVFAPRTWYPNEGAREIQSAEDIEYDRKLGVVVDPMAKPYEEEVKFVLRDMLDLVKQLS